jgi:hypothetical protein
MKPLPSINPRKEIRWELYQVHSISSGGDETNIADGVQGNKLDEINRLMHIMNGHELDTSELPVDTSYEFIDSRTQILVFFDIASGGNGDLYKDHLPSTLI